MIDLSVGVELTLEALSLLPLVSLSLRSAVASLLACLFATWPRCCLDDPDGAVPRQSARLARVLLTATACRRPRARERFRRDLFRCELSLAHTTTEDTSDAGHDEYKGLNERVQTYLEEI